ncbi:hypothetical protein COCOBI_13-3120 [Coccomyxa sp. Obi]|nr:hypothetical protein COCOBI_13-3120 [Coccomyxa sp. Obi]
MAYPNGSAETNVQVDAKITLDEIYHSTKGARLDGILEKIEDRLKRCGICVDSVLRRELGGPSGYRDVPIGPYDKAKGDVTLVLRGVFIQDEEQAQKSACQVDPELKLASNIEETKKTENKVSTQAMEIFIHVIVSQTMEILMKRKYGHKASTWKFDQALQNDADFGELLDDLIEIFGSLRSKNIIKMAKFSWLERDYKATHVNCLMDFQDLLSLGIDLLFSMGNLNFWMQYRLEFLLAVLCYTMKPQYIQRIAKVEMADRIRAAFAKGAHGVLWDEVNANLEAAKEKV